MLSKQTNDIVKRDLEQGYNYISACNLALQAPSSKTQ